MKSNFGDKETEDKIKTERIDHENNFLKQEELINSNRAEEKKDLRKLKTIVSFPEHDEADSSVDKKVNPMQSFDEDIESVIKTENEKVISPGLDPTVES